MRNGKASLFKNKVDVLYEHNWCVTTGYLVVKNSEAILKNGTKEVAIGRDV
ncbi:hypothetical protein [Pseudoalteromonas sp. T1lg23B]|uniref:hypothetical protein n=1 Tax=Pseudoalteromonas sp. T1lg23B TaxID=2077097 RepID=UPI001319CF22|nr:hypothetical protein [Pseudoalteromonas sp. T1lg23B]